MMPSPTDLRDWAPVRISWQNGNPQVEWCYFGDLRFTHPFFDQTVLAAFRRPFSLLFRHQTTIEFLDQFIREVPTVKPSGFIFHMSRCGSTLLSQMLAALPDSIVISEAGPLDFALRAPRAPVAVSEATRCQWLKWVVGGLGQQRAQEKHYFIKWDAWHVFYLPLILQAFPDVPWVFVYRDPLEVMVSHRTHPGAVMVPGLIDLRDFGLTPTDMIWPRTQEEYCGRVLAIMLQSALSAEPVGRSRFVNYSQLPEVVFEELLEFFGVQPAAQTLKRMRDLVRFDVKNPSAEFCADSARKREQADTDLRRVADTLVRPLYEQLEARRLELSND